MNVPRIGKVVSMCRSLGRAVVSQCVFCLIFGIINKPAISACPFSCMRQRMSTSAVWKNLHMQRYLPPLIYRQMRESTRRRQIQVVVYSLTEMCAEETRKFCIIHIPAVPFVTYRSVECLRNRHPCHYRLNSNCL